MSPASKHVYERFHEVLLFQAFASDGNSCGELQAFFVYAPSYVSLIFSGRVIH